MRELASISLGSTQRRLRGGREDLRSPAVQKKKLLLTGCQFERDNQALEKAKAARRESSTSLTAERADLVEAEKSTWLRVHRGSGNQIARRIVDNCGI